MRKSLLACCLLVFAAFGQSADKSSFEVATVKASAALPPGNGRAMVIGGGKRGGPGTSDPGQITWPRATLTALLAVAYDVKPFQVTGPAWLNTEAFDIAAKVPPGTTPEQLALMWQSLLAERFGLVLHHDSKIFPVDELTIAKGGPKLKASDAAPAAADEPQPEKQPGSFVPPKLDKNGFPQLTQPGLVMMMTMGPNGPNARMVAKGQTLDQLASTLTRQFNHPVVDKTGLKGKFDFSVEFAPDPNDFRPPPGLPPPGPGPAPGGDASRLPPGAADPSGLTLIGALQQQLGLRLQATKAPLDILVIDRANKTPTDN